MMHGFGMMNGYGIGAGFPGILFLIFQFVFWGAVIYLIFLSIKKLNAKDNTHNNIDNSLKIIRERYASGEITEEEFKKLKKDLSD